MTACFKKSDVLESLLPQIGGRMAASFSCGVEHPRSSKSAIRSAQPRKYDKGLESILWNDENKSGQKDVNP